MERRFQARGENELRLAWDHPPAIRRLLRNEIHCWCVRLDLSLASIEKLSSLLSRDECERAGRFRVEEARRNYIAARGSLRCLLSEYLQIPPQDLVFLYEPNGKPLLAPWFGKEVQFNLSHSGKLALVAVAAKHPVGVDVEKIGSVPEAADIARKMFSPEAAVRVQSEASVGQEFFFRTWTRNEALLKCTGEGLSEKPGTSLNVRETLVCELAPAPGYVGAVAVKSSSPMALNTWRWDIELFSPWAVPAKAGLRQM